MGTKKWVQVARINSTGLCAVVEHKDELHIVEEELIHFYRMAREHKYSTNGEETSWTVTHRQSMNNFIGCSHMIFDPEQQYCCTYKKQQEGFQYFTRKQQHSFSVVVNDTDMEHSFGINIRNAAGFIITVQRGNSCALWICSDGDYAV